MINLLSGPSPSQMWPYEAAAINILRQSFDEGQLRAVSKALTGFGKSVVTANIIQSALTKGKWVIFVVTRIIVFNHAEAKFRREWICLFAAIRVNHYSKNLGTQVEVASAQILARRTVADRFMLEQIDDAAMTASEMIHVQKISGGQRTNPRKLVCLIKDHAGNALSLGMVANIAHDRLDTCTKIKAKPSKLRDPLPRSCTARERLHHHHTLSRLSQGGQTAASTVQVEPGSWSISQANVPPWPGSSSLFGGLFFLAGADPRGRSHGRKSHHTGDKFGIWPTDFTEMGGGIAQEIPNWVKAKDIDFAESCKRGAA